MKNYYKKTSSRFLKLATLLLLIIFSFSQAPTYAEKINELNECLSENCYITPNEVAVAHSGAFSLVVDSSENPFLRKVNLVSGDFINNIDIPLTSSESGNFHIKIDSSDKTAFIYNRTSLQVVNLKDNSVKPVSVISSNNPITSLDTIGSEGRVIVGTDNEDKPKALVLDTKSDSILSTIELDDLSNNVVYSNKLNKVVVTHSEFLAQSATVIDLEDNSTKRLDTPSSVFFDIEDFIALDSFDLKETFLPLSSFDGKHVFHILDLDKEIIATNILNDSDLVEGTSITDISPDSSFSITTGNNATINGFTVYKLNTKDKTAPKIVTKKTFKDVGIAIDVDITPDQHKVFALIQKDNKTRTLKILSAKDLSELNTFTISANKNSGLLELDPYGRFAIIPEVVITNIVNNTVVVNNELAPAKQSITLNSAQIANGLVKLKFDSDSLGCKTLFFSNDVSAQADGVSTCIGGDILNTSSSQNIHLFSLDLKPGSQVKLCTNSTDKICSNAVVVTTKKRDKGSTCGNGITERGEECDGSNYALGTCGSTCSLSCTGGGEGCRSDALCDANGICGCQCDKSIKVSTPICPIPACAAPAKGCTIQGSTEKNANGCPKFPCGIEVCNESSSGTCGDGVIDVDKGEECDPKASTAFFTNCSNTCKVTCVSGASKVCKSNGCFCVLARKVGGANE